MRADGAFSPTTNQKVGCSNQPGRASETPCPARGFVVCGGGGVREGDVDRRVQPDEERRPQAADFTFSRMMRGCRAAIRSNPIAGPSGCRRPCSQFRRVCTLIPIACANCGCERPTNRRSEAMSSPDSIFPSMSRFRTRAGIARDICSAVNSGTRVMTSYLLDAPDRAHLLASFTPPDISRTGILSQWLMVQTPRCDAQPPNGAAGSGGGAARHTLLVLPCPVARCYGHGR